MLSVSVKWAATATLRGRLGFESQEGTARETWK